MLLGDGESAEGSVWEAADIGAAQKLDNLCAIVDVNALGQSGPTQFGHNMDELSRRWSAFGWQSLVHRRSRHAGDSRRVEEGARNHRPSNGSVGTHTQRQGRCVGRRKRRLAR